MEKPKCMTVRRHDVYQERKATIEYVFRTGSIQNLLSFSKLLKVQSISINKQRINTLCCDFTKPKIKVKGNSSRFLCKNEIYLNSTPSNIPFPLLEPIAKVIFGANNGHILLTYTQASRSTVNVFSSTLCCRICIQHCLTSHKYIL